jgi:hypothetical protein
MENYFSVIRRGDDSRLQIILARFVSILMLSALAGCASDITSPRSQSNNPLDAIEAVQDTNPYPVKQVRPKWPRTTAGNVVFSAGAEVEVILSLTIGEDGVSRDISGKVTQTDSKLSGEKLQLANQAFIDSAVTAVSKWKWQPALKNGRPVAAPWKMPMIFTLSNM